MSKVADPSQFGVAQFDAAGKLTDILEKPQNPPSDMAVTGIYLYNKSFLRPLIRFKNPRAANMKSPTFIPICLKTVIKLVIRK